MIVLKIVSTVCVMGALYLLVVWTLRMSARVYAIGQSVAREPEFAPPQEITELPIISTAAKYGVSFLPLVRRLVAKNRLAAVETLEGFETQLIRGGIRHLITPEQLYAATIVSGVFLGTMLALLGMVLFGPIGAVVVGFPAGFIAGFFLPRALLNAHVSNRIALMEKRLPYAIEFMLLTMEANATFPMALEVYCDQMGEEDPLAQEFSLVLNDITAGIGVQAAFVNMGKRIESEQLSALILAITTGLETGMPVAELLAIEADAARLRRYQNAEELAKTAGTRAIFPLFLAVIAIIILIIGPMALKFAETPLMF
jgi:Flp pilus assembly protein TadB